MKEIIDQISRIDAIAYENEQKNKSILNNEKLRLENEIKKYREQRMKASNEKAQLLHDRIVAEAKMDYHIQEEKNRELSHQFEQNYNKVEKAVIREILEKLFPCKLADGNFILNDCEKG